MLALDVDERTRLAQLVPEDADELYLRVASERERLAAWLPWAASSTLPGTRAFCEDSFARSVRGEGFDLGLWHEGRLVGAVGAHGVDPLSGTLSLGWWLSAEAEGRGLMSRACAAVLDHVFGPMGMHRVEIRVEPENLRSLALVRRLGAREEGRAREAALLRGVRRDLLVFGLLATDRRP